MKRIRRQGGSKWAARRFCSTACKVAADRAGKIERERELLPDSECAAEWTRERARRLYPVAGEACECCGGAAGVRHHRDENPRNNAPENVALLCRGCHVWIHKKRAPGSLAEAKARHEKELRRISYVVEQRRETLV